MTMPELALRHILQHPAVSHGHPGHAQAAARRAEPRQSATDSRLPAPLMAELKKHRWDRTVDFE